jgi:hypothetical protein
MADKKVTQLTALTAPANNDLLMIIDDPLGSPISKKITIEDLLGSTSQLQVGGVDIVATNDMELGGNNVVITGVTSVAIDGALTINDAGADEDTVIKGDNDANCFYVDASTDRVGIGTDTPTDKLDVNANSIRVRTAQTPASGNNLAVNWPVGRIAWDTNWLYVAANSTNIVRVALSTF